MTVSELIDILGGYAGDEQIYFSYPYGDMQQSDAVVKIDGVNWETVKRRRFQFDRIAMDSDYDEDEKGDIEDCIVIS